MRRRTLPAATALAVLFSSVALVATGAGSAAADSSSPLSLKSTGAIVVDGAHQRVFISDPTAGQVVVTDYAGSVVGTVGALPGVRGLELSADSGTVYAAVGDADAIVAIDTATATEAHRWSTGTADPQYLAATGGRIWFGYGGAAQGNIGSLDLSGTDPVVTLNQAPTNAWYSAPILDASAGAPGTLVAGAADQSPVVLAVYDVSSGTPSQTAYAFDPGSTGGGNLMDMAVTPDGKDVVTASGAPYYQAVYKLSDLSKDGKYVTNPYPNAVDIAPNGDIAAGTSSTDEADVHLFEPGTSLPLKEYTFGSDQLTARGLAWAPDSSRLFAVSRNGDAYALHVYDDPTKVATTLTSNAPATGTRGTALTVTGKLTSSAAFPAGTKVSVTRTDDESPSGKLLGEATVAADGSYSFPDTPPAGGKVTYAVSYAGDTDHAGATSTSSVTVAKTAATVTLNNNLKVYGYNSSVVFTAHLGATYKNRTVEIWADPYGSDKPNTLVKKGTVDANGNLTATVRLTRDTKVSAKFTGDTRYSAKTTTNTVYTKVSVTSSLSGAYKTATAWNATYAYFHQSKDPVHNTSMTMYPGRKYQFQIQQFYSGAWHTTAAEYFALDRYGKDSVQLDDNPPTGVRFRIRSSYIDTKSGDNVNATTYGGWKYFTFTR
ncbi:MAG: Ig-like domain repeat protein [Streptomyces sp.]|nr:Ig-like domain repeat protein [Streptomyces sp.]NUT24362.1 Ig-like domain repeat protein [Streptomyces sp.]